MKTILVTGSNGLLGQKIIYALRNRSDVKCISTSRGENRMREKSGYIYESLDITDAQAIEELFLKYRPDSVINTAAMTNVDACETNRDDAWKMNVTAVDYLIDACKKIDAHLVHLSTDFVFDGRNGPYVETDEANPLSFYGHTKYEAEKRLMASGLHWAILRTIIIYGVLDDNSRSNVVLWAINSIRSKKTITVINDQFRSPTLAEDLADACISASLKKAEGIYHVSGMEVMNILDIVKIVAEFFDLDQQYIQPISSESLKQPAVRPPVTGFIIEKAVRELDYHPHTFIEGLSYLKKQLELVVK
ncbi:MAG: SDR family oxidoreductase [Bacteroidetes bacterium]|nr:SDR family oxidoreductase [Bacteroidota bacterium]